MILLYGDKCQRKESRETITAGLERAFAGTNRVPEALGAIRAGLEGAGIESAVVLTERIGKIGFIDRGGAIAIPPQFAGASAFCHDRALVHDGAMAWEIDRHGQVTRPKAPYVPVADPCAE